MSVHNLAPHARPGDKAELHCKTGDFMPDPPLKPLATLTVGKDQSVSIDVPHGAYWLLVNGVHVSVLGSPGK